MPIPDRLVTVREYDAVEQTKDDLARLAAAGIVGHVQTGRYGHTPDYSEGPVQLRVSEGSLEKALSLLGPQVPLLFDRKAKERAALTCPRCHESRAIARPPYALLVGIAGLCVATWFTIKGEAMFALLAGGVTVAAVTVVARRAKHFRCEICGEMWTPPQD